MATNHHVLVSTAQEEGGSASSPPTLVMIDGHQSDRVVQVNVRLTFGLTTIEVVRLAPGMAVHSAPMTGDGFAPEALEALVFAAPAIALVIDGEAERFRAKPDGLGGWRADMRGDPLGDPA